jgi:hypothetical protein
MNPRKAGNANGALPGAGGARSWGGHYCTDPAGDDDFTGKIGDSGWQVPAGPSEGADLLDPGQRSRAVWVPGRGGEGGTGTVGAAAAERSWAAIASGS